MYSDPNKDVADPVHPLSSSQQKPLEVRRDIGAGVVSFVCSPILLTIGGLALYFYYLHGNPLVLIFGMGMALFGLYHLSIGSICFLNREPVLILNENGLTYRSIFSRPRVIRWDNIRSADLYRSVRTLRGTEASATLSLELIVPVEGSQQIKIDLDGLDVNSTAILDAIGKWANLSHPA
jgi:Bacterial PH domain